MSESTDAAAKQHGVLSEEEHPEAPREGEDQDLMESHADAEEREPEEAQDPPKKPADMGVSDPNNPEPVANLE